MIQETSLFVPIKEDRLHLKRLFVKPDGKAVLMIHGSMESGNIFYSKSLKGLGPYLALQGFDVYVADLRGRGQSTPLVSAAAKNSQLDAIQEEIPALVAAIRAIKGNDAPIAAVAHSWGGVLLLAYLARFPQETFHRACFLGTKRSIKVNNLRKLLSVDLVWIHLGEKWAKKYGYFPAKEKKIGSDNESAQLYRDCRAWVLAKDEWLDPSDGFNYLEAFRRASNVPPTLYVAGKKDHYLGNTIDVKRLMAEVGHKNDQLLLLSKENGHAKDYGHIDMCTAPEASKDHFPTIAKWLLG